MNGRDTTYSDVLLNCRKHGARLVLAFAPDLPVSYRPRGKGDQTPWIVDGADGRRYAPESVIPTTPDGGRWDTGALLV